MDEMKDWSQPDWSREKPAKFWDPSKKLINSIRKYQKVRLRRGPFYFIIKKIYVIKHKFWSIVTSADIPITCNIGGGILLPHPNGIVIHPDAEIGVNCLILQQVTITNFVKIGYHVDFGAGSKIIGPLEIGNNVNIGANSVVIRDIPSDTVAVGVPSRILDK